MLVSHSVDKYGIAKVALHDKNNKNMFNKEFIIQLVSNFKEINQNENVKVILIHGYDKYFCCGGTQTELLNIYHGKNDFTEAAFYRLLLECPLPTIAAMQGHALGGGLAFACYADIMILAQEAIYSANFMKYGFTPGMGATYMIPYKLGIVGHEMLYTAKNYLGGELKARGISQTILPGEQVIQFAYEMACEIAENPRLALCLLKEQLTEILKNKITIVVKQEIKMHQQCFKQEEVKTRIETLFGN